MSADGARTDAFTIAHISDIHCGGPYFVPNLMERAISEINDLSPSIVICSGDLTTFGFKPEYAQARAYLDRLDCDHGDAVLPQDGVSIAEQILEMDVTDIARVVISRNDDERTALEPVEVPLRLVVFLLEPVRRQVAGAHDDVGLELVDVRDRALHEIGHEMRVSAVDVGEVRDRDPLPHAWSLEADGLSDLAGTLS